MRFSALTLSVFLLPPSTTFSFLPTTCFHRRIMTKSSIRSTYYAEPMETTTTADEDEEAVMKQLDFIAHNLKLEIFDLDEGIFGFESKNNRYGIEVVRAEIDIEPSLGLELTEMAAANDGRGLVLISGVSGNAASSGAAVGDVITGVFAGTKFAERTTALDYDNTVESISKAKEVAVNEGGKIRLELDRLVERAKIHVEVEGPVVDGGKTTIEALAGENLRRLLVRKGIKMYDTHTKRFDMPYATGDCGGEGLCGTCLVNVVSGAEALSPPDDQERLVTKGRPLSWRASCRTVVGYDNKEGTIKLQIHPQSGFADELNPGVKSVFLDE